MDKERNKAKNKVQAKNEIMDFSKIGKTVDATEIRRNQYTTGGKWKKETIIQFLQWCERNLPYNKAKVLSIEDVFNTFYQANNEKIDDIKANEKRLISFVRTFVKTANKYAKQNGISVHVGVKDKVNIKIQRIE